MPKKEISTKPVAEIGEEIGLELGKEFIHNYQTVNPTSIPYFQTGRNILDRILAQPNCHGIRFYSAYNELGEETLVYVGLDKGGKAIVEYASVNKTGTIELNIGIVGDRMVPPRPTGGGQTSDNEDWNITLD